MKLSTNDFINASQFRISELQEAERYQQYVRVHVRVYIR